MSASRVCVIGLGYIGLPTAATIAAHGHQVIGVDVSEKAVATINSGAAHIVEPDLDGAVKRVVSTGALRAQLAPEPADFFMICVPTPFGREENGIPTPDISYVLQAADSIAPHLMDGSVVVIESTSPVGTTDEVEARLRRQTSAKFLIAYCPERVLPGKILRELIDNDRIVGGQTPEAADRVAELYRTFVKGGIFKTTARTAEMAKLVENSYRDVNIAFANELSLVCANAGIDVWELISLANRHPRVNILQPGCGVGGHCIAVDPWFIVSMDPQNARLIHMARQVNDAKPGYVVGQVAARAEELRDQLGRAPVIACLGLAFKPDVDDFRGSPAFSILQRLGELGYAPHAVEPFATEAVGDASLLSLEEALDKADILVGLVRHKAFAGLRSPKLMDFCGIDQL